MFVCCVFYRAQAGCPMLDLQVRGSALPCEWSAGADTPRDGRRTRTPFVGAVRLRAVRTGGHSGCQSPKQRCTLAYENANAKTHRALLSYGGFSPDPPEDACRLKERVTRETHGSVCRRSPGPLTEQVPSFATYGPSTFQPRARRWSAGNPGTQVGFRHARASPSTHHFQRPPGTSLTYTELSPAQPSGSMLQSGMDAHPGAYAPGRCTVSRSPGSAPLALRGGVRHSSMVGGDGTATGEKEFVLRPGPFAPKR